MDNLEKLTQELAQTYKQIEARRNHWHTVTREFILKQLTAVAEKHKLNWNAGVNEAWQNLESVFIAFNPSASGIVERNAYNQLQKVKTGGLLSFSQSRGGMVVVWMAYPLVEGLNEETPKNTTLETLEPENVNEECIQRHLEKFLEEMIEWENDGRDEIGFVRKHR
jgi:hypothetical protein